LYKINVGIAWNLLNYYSKRGFEGIKFLFIGSAAEYGIPDVNPIDETASCNPVNEYGLTKLYQTELALYFIRKYNANISIARIFNVDGLELSDKLAIGRWRKEIQTLSDNSILKVGNLNTIRDYLDIHKVAQDLLVLCLHGKPLVYNVCSGKPTIMSDLLQEIINNSGKKIRIQRDLNLIRTDDVPEIIGNRLLLNSLYQEMRIDYDN